MHPEGAAEPADHHEQVHELPVRGQQLTELVDHHEETWQRGEVRPRGTGALVLQGGGVVACGAQQLLAPDQFTVQGVLHTLDQRDLVGEVGDDGGGVREFLQTEEGGSTLEVDQDEVEGLGGVRQGEPQDERAQEFALAGAGGSDEHAVRAHAALRGLLDVEVHRAAVHADRDRYPKPCGARVTVEEGLRVVPVQVGDAEQRGQLHVRVHRLRDVGAQAHPAGGDQPGQRLRAEEAEPVGPAERHRALLAAAVGAHQAHLVGAHGQPQGVAAGAPAQRPGYVEGQCVAVAVSLPAVALGHGDAVQDDDRVGLVAAGARFRVEAGAFGELGTQEVVEFGDVGGDPAGLSGAVLLVRVQRVREPLGPFPVGPPLVADAEGDPQLLRRVEHRQLAEHGAHQGTHRFLAGALARLPGRGAARPGGFLVGCLLGAQQHPGRRTQVEAEGLPGDGGVGADEAAQGVRAEGFEVLDRPGGDRVQGECELLLADRETDLAEVLVGRAPLPQPRGAGQ